MTLSSRPHLTSSREISKSSFPCFSEPEIRMPLQDCGATVDKQPPGPAVQAFLRFQQELDFSQGSDGTLIFALTSLFAILLVPLLVATHIPLKFDWPLYLRFCLVRGLEVVPIAGALLVSTMSWSELSAALLRRGSWKGLARRLTAIAIPAGYLFCGLVIVFGYNDVIASVRFYAMYDHFAAAVDSWFLGGSSISAIARRVAVFHPGFGSWAATVYATFYPVIGAALIFLALKAGRRRAVQFVNTLMVQYYLALFLFFLMPIQGPFYSSPRQSTGPDAVEQVMLLEQANQALHHTKTIIGFDYFIGFPSLHVGMVILAWWFLREWKLPGIVASLYLALVIPSVLLVEWHYLVDVFGGVAVAAASIAITNLASGRRPAKRVYSPQFLPPASGAVRDGLTPD